MNVELAIALAIPALAALLAVVLAVDAAVCGCRYLYRATRRHLMGDHSFPATEPTLGETVNLRREPATLWIGLVAPLVQAIAAFLWVDDPAIQGYVSAAAVAVAGVIVAIQVKDENLLPIITGAIQAVMALAIAFGVGWTAEQQSVLVAALGAIAAYIVRANVSAPVPAPSVNA